MKLEQTAENPDGSADFIISDMTDEEVMSFVRLGIVKALEDAIEDAKKYDPGVEVKEPVAWVRPNGELVVRPDYGGKIYYSEQSVYNHASPLKQKEWVGLGEQRPVSSGSSYEAAAFVRGATWAEEVLRKKNT